MSRITGTDAANLIEAYNSLYAPQEEVELTEEQVQEDFENWVNSLVEEGHDLSEFTWEDMYEHYLNEAPIRYSTGPTAADLQRQRAQASPKPAPTPSRPIRYSTGPSAADLQRQRQSQTAQNTGMYGRYAPPSMQQPTPARPAATAPVRPAAPVARPTTPVSQRPAPSPATRPAGGTPSYAGATGVKPVGTSVAGNFKPVAGAPSQTSTFSAPPKPVNPQMAGMPTGVTTPAAPKPQLSARAQALKAGGPQGGARERMLNQDLDLFDIVKGYLIDEGYAETEEAAAVIMANMSEEWKQSIVEQMTVNVADVKGGTKAALNAQGGMKDKSGNPMYRPGVGVGPDFKLLKGV